MSLLAVSVSAQHTGTHFVAKLFSDLTGLQADWIAKVPGTLFNQGDLGMLQGHLYPEDWDQPDAPHSNACVELMMRSGLPMLIPMRCPVRALITHYEREHGEHPRMTFDQHVRAIQRALNYGRVASTPVHMIPVDLVDGRVELVEGLGAVFGSPQDRIGNTLKNWKPVNVTHPDKHTFLRSWYDRGKWDSLDGILKGSVSQCRELLTTPLRSLGYNLPWMT